MVTGATTNNHAMAVLVVTVAGSFGTNSAAVCAPAPADAPEERRWEAERYRRNHAAAAHARSNAASTHAVMWWVATTASATTKLHSTAVVLGGRPFRRARKKTASIASGRASDS